MDWVGIVLLVMPVFLPIVLKLPVEEIGLLGGLDPSHVPVWFGVTFCMNMQVSFLSPPFGPAAFYLKSVAPSHITLTDIFKGFLPFIALQLLALSRAADLAADRDPCSSEDGTHADRHADETGSHDRRLPGRGERPAARPAGPACGANMPPFSTGSTTTGRPRVACRRGEPAISGTSCWPATPPAATGSSRWTSRCPATRSRRTRRSTSAPPSST